MAEDSEFHLFPKLPLELRRKIWSHSLFERVIEIRWNRRLDFYYSTTPSPAILHTCQEARMEALRAYELLEARSETKKVIGMIANGEEAYAGGKRGDEFAGDDVSGGAEIEDELNFADMRREALNQNIKVVEYIESTTSDTLTCILATPSHKDRLVFVMFRTYINYDNDILYLSDPHLRASREYPNDGDPAIGDFLSAVYDPSKIRHLALTSGTSTDPTALAQGFLRCKALERIIFACGDTCCAVDGPGLRGSPRHKNSVSFQRQPDIPRDSNWESIMRYWTGPSNEAGEFLDRVKKEYLQMLPDEGDESTGEVTEEEDKDEDTLIRPSDWFRSFKFWIMDVTRE